MRGIRQGFVLSVTGVALCLATTIAAGQEAPRPGWLPRTVEIGGVTPAQRAAAVARLDQIQRLLMQVPGLANPRGFEIQPRMWGGSRQLGPSGEPVPGSVVEYRLLLSFFVPSKQVAGEGCACLWVSVNAPAPVGPAAIKDATGRQIYTESERGAPLPPAVQVYGNLSEERIRSSTYLMFASADALPWKTVSRQEYYDAVRFDWEGKGGEKQADFRAALAKTPYDAWMEGAAERKKQREQMIASARRSRSAEDVEKFRQQLEQNERSVGEQLKASATGDGERNKQALALSNNRTAALAAELEKMTPAERAMPALIDNALSEGPIATGARMTSVDSPKSWRVLTPNYDFWRARSSPMEARSISISIEATATGLHPVVHPVLIQAFKTLDWAAFNRMLAIPR